MAQTGVIITFSDVSAPAAEEKYNDKKTSQEIHERHNIFPEEASSTTCICTRLPVLVEKLKRRRRESILRSE